MKNRDILVDLAETVMYFAHRGQKTRDGGAYALHPLMVADIADPLHKHRVIRMIALLHDVLEDSEWTSYDLTEAGFPIVVVDAVVALTKIEGEPYESYIKNVKTNFYACWVKIADITHNMDLMRMPKIRVKDVRKNRVYRKTRRDLINHINNEYKL